MKIYLIEIYICLPVVLNTCFPACVLYSCLLVVLNIYRFACGLKNMCACGLVQLFACGLVLLCLPVVLKMHTCLWS